MRYKIIIDCIVFVSLFHFFYEQILHSWDSQKSWTKESTGKIILSRSYFNGESIETYTSGSRTYLSFSSTTSPVDITNENFTQISSFIKFENDYYLCTSGVNQPPIYKFSNDLFTNIGLPYDIGSYSTWSLECFYKPRAQQGIPCNALVVAFYGTKFLYWYKMKRGYWGNKIQDVENYYIRFIIRNAINIEFNSNFYYYFYSFFYNEKNGYGISFGKIYFGDNKFETEPSLAPIHAVIDKMKFDNLGKTKILFISTTDSAFTSYIVTYGTGSKVYKATLEDIQMINYVISIEPSLPLNYEPETYIITDFSL